MAGAGFYAYQKGYHHEFYGADEFGALRAEITINTMGQNEAARYIRGTLLVRGPKGYTPGQNGILEFTPDGPGE